MAGRSDHEAVLDLLRAFGIDTTDVQAVEVRAALHEVTTVTVTRLVLSADPSQVEATYAVTAGEVSA